MDYQTFRPHPDLSSLVKCYWTLKVPEQKEPERQLILPDGCIEMAFLFADPIKRYISHDDFVIGPRQVVIGQIKRKTYIEPTGSVDSFAVRFYPYGFANFSTAPIEALADTETPLAMFFGEEASMRLADEMDNAGDTHKRIDIVERFLFERLRNPRTIDNLVQSTIDTMVASQGARSVTTMLENDRARRRRLEREFKRRIGISPKQLGRVIRLQAALKRILRGEPESLTEIAYESEYYDQAHFIKDFKEFTGTTPKKFLGSAEMELSALLYR